MSARERGAQSGDQRFIQRGANFSLVRFSLAGAIGVAANLMLALSVVLANPLSTGAQCQDPTSSTLYTGYNGSEYWYAQIYTANSDNSPCYNCAEGAKGNLTHGGLPYTYDSTTQHVNVYLTSGEDPNVCWPTHHGIAAPGCWIQVGWITGYVGLCSGSTSTGSAVELYVEVYDDSAQFPGNQTCTVALFNSVPQYASYDERFYGMSPNNLYRYQAYYQQPGGSIQDLAYGDFIDQNQLQVAAGEALSPETVQGFPQKCPALGQIQGGNWNTLGVVAPNNNSGLFADYLNLYKGGSWTRWTNAATPHTAILQNAPYQVSGVSSSSTDFGTFQNGGL